MYQLGLFVYFNILKMANFGVPSSPLAGDRHMHPLTSKLSAQVLLFEAFFDIVQFSVFEHFLISKIATFGAPYLPSKGAEGDRRMRSLTFSHGIDFTIIKPSEGC